MKKLISIMILSALSVIAAFMLTGCEQPTVRVESVLTISPEFSGSRTVTVIYPLSTDIDAVKDAIIENSPAADTDGAEFVYKGVEGDGYYFELSFDFSDKDEYEEQIAAVIGRSASALLSQKNTVLTKGTRMAENFASSDLIGWITRISADENATKDLNFDYSANTVTIGGESFKTGSTTDINDVEGSTVNSVSIKTSNSKQDSYDRTLVFSVPIDTYLASKDDFESYFLTNTAPEAGFNGWSSEGANMLYTVIFQDLSLESLQEYTAMLLDTDNSDVFYGDRDNSSTPLSEGLVYEERLDTFSFIGPDKGAPTLNYSYSLPTSTIHGDGAVYKDGRWITEGKWEDGVYKLETDSGAVQLRVPDGIQYSINGINFYLESLGDQRFRRTTSFLYSKTDGYDGMNFALNFFTEKGAQTVVDEDEDNLICSVISEGTPTQITDELVSLFGSGNFMTYRRNTGAFALSTKSSFTDYISLGSILNSTNANRPMRYYISSEGDENIVSVTIDGSETAYESPSKTPLTVTGGVGTVEYRGNIPITSNIIVYVLIGSAMLAVTILICMLLLARREPKINKEAQRIIDESGADEDIKESTHAPSLSQTTTFSISELGALTRNKKYAEEIDRDVERRMEAERLRQLEDEIRRKELNEMQRKVYGTEDQSDFDGGSEGNGGGELADSQPSAEQNTSADPMSLLENDIDSEDDYV